MWLCGFYYGAFYVEFRLALCSRVVVFSPFSIVITSLGEERVGLCTSCAFIYFPCIDFCSSSLALGVGGCLWPVIVALPGFFY